ncbi:alpha/beta hydrolase [Methylobacterium sp. JK268]
MALGLLVASLLVVLAVAGAVLAFQRMLIYPGAFFTYHAPRDPPAGTEAIRVATADGETLHALWRAPAPGCGVVVSFHGNASEAEFHAERFAGEPWRSRGWGLLAPTYRGYPGATGRPSEAGLVLDGLAALDEARRRAPDAAILLHGHSLGTAVAVAVAAERPHLGLYLEAPFDSMVAMAKLHFPYLPALLLRDSWRSDARIAAVSGPILIVHGDADPVIPLAFARRLAEAAPPGARFEAVAGDHVSLLGTRDGEAEPLFRARIPAGCVAG